MTDKFAPDYRVASRPDGVHYVVASSASGREYVATQFTKDKDLAESWCRHLRRAAQVEEDRKKAARGGR